MIIAVPKSWHFENAIVLVAGNLEFLCENRVCHVYIFGSSGFLVAVVRRVMEAHGLALGLRRAISF